MLLVISKNYWGADMMESTAIRFKDTFVDMTHMEQEDVVMLMGDRVNVNNVKTTLYETVKNTLIKSSSDRPVLYVYMSGHGNQVADMDGDERIPIIDGESSKDYNDEVYQLPDGNVVDDDITNIIQNAVVDTNSDKRLLVVLFSDHCSSGSMIDNRKVDYDWVSIGACSDMGVGYMSGIGGVMSVCMISVLSGDVITKSVREFYELLDKEMRMSFIGELQLCTVHVSSVEMLNEKVFMVRHK